MKSFVDNVITGIPVVQNKQDYIIGVFTIKQFFKFTKFTERILQGFDDDDEPIYNGQVQRSIEKGRVEKIADFLINDPDATFPTNIVLHIPNEAIEEQQETDRFVKIHLKSKVFDKLNSRNREVYITIIDGQHRIKGIEIAIERLKVFIRSLEKTLANGENLELRKKYNYYIDRLEDLLNIELVVSFFIDKTIEYQAMIFSTINRTQKRVSESLVYSLFGLDTGDTPQKTALQVILKLNSHEKSPFYKRIKLYGGKYSKDKSSPLSQATMAKRIVNLICENLRESENDRYKDRRDLLENKSNKLLPFRLFYANNQDHKISDILFYYFNAVREVFLDKTGKSYWDFNKNDKKPTNIFHTTVGFDSLMKILIDLLKMENIKEASNTEIFTKYLSKTNHLNITNINRYSFNNRGKKFLYLDMSLAIWPHDFNNPKDTRKEELEELEKER